MACFTHRALFRVCVHIDSSVPCLKTTFCDPVVHQTPKLNLKQAKEEINNLGTSLMVSQLITPFFPNNLEYIFATLDVLPCSYCCQKNFSKGTIKLYCKCTQLLEYSPIRNTVLQQLDLTPPPSPALSPSKKSLLKTDYMQKRKLTWLASMPSSCFSLRCAALRTPSAWTSSISASKLSG